MKHLNRFELNAILIALWFCIGEFFTLVILLITPKWGIAWYYLSNGALLIDRKEVYIEIFNKNYQYWQLMNVGWIVYLYGFIILLLLINIKRSFNKCINNN